MLMDKFKIIENSIQIAIDPNYFTCTTHVKIR